MPYVIIDGKKHLVLQEESENRRSVHSRDPIGRSYLSLFGFLDFLAYLVVHVVWLCITAVVLYFFGYGLLSYFRGRDSALMIIESASPTWWIDRAWSYFWKERYTCMPSVEKLYCGTKGAVIGCWNFMDDYILEGIGQPHLDNLKLTWEKTAGLWETALNWVENLDLFSWFGSLGAILKPVWSQLMIYYGNIHLAWNLILLAFSGRRGITHVVTKVAKFTAERMQLGSQLWSIAKSPKFQCEILDSTGRFIGCGFRTTLGREDVLVTAYHCLTEQMITLRKNTVEITISRDDFRTFPGADFATLPYNVVATLALAKAKHGCLEKNTAVTISTETQASCGTLKDSKFFGHYIYGGSTLGGFSGSAYYVGNMVFGMHRGAAGTINVGLAISFMDMACRTGDMDVGIGMSRKENTGDAIERMIAKGVEVYYRRTGDPDKIMVTIKGRYYEVDTDTEQGRRIMKGAREFGYESTKKTVEPVASTSGEPTKKKKEGTSTSVQTEAVIPQSALPQASLAPAYNDQVSAPFLGKRAVFIRPSETSKTVSSTPLTPSSDSVGPESTKKQSGNRTTSTVKSPNKKNKDLNRTNILRSLTELLPTLQVGEQKLVSMMLVSGMSTHGLNELLNSLSPTSTGKQVSDAAP